MDLGPTKMLMASILNFKTFLHHPLTSTRFIGSLKALLVDLALPQVVLYKICKYKRTTLETLVIKKNNDNHGDEKHKNDHLWVQWRRWQGQRKGENDNNGNGDWQQCKTELSSSDLCFPLPAEERFSQNIFVRLKSRSSLKIYICSTHFSSEWVLLVRSVSFAFAGISPIRWVTDCLNEW